jgi:E3 ubiquitin-protein ligase NRDP1
MSGYELSRFVDLDQSDVEELICSICHDILRNPVFTNCCLQTFCEQCINDWLETNNTCPYDRQQLNKSQLYPSQRYEKCYL